jgi:hypothetical protein
LEIQKQLLKYLRISLVSVNLSYPEIIQDYNIPLRNHSGKVSLIYNQKTKKTKIHFELFEGVAGADFKNLEILGQLLYTTPFKGKVISDFLYDDNKNMLTFDLEVESIDQAEYVFKCTRSICEQTFERHRDLVILKKLFDQCAKEDKDFDEKISKKIHELLSSSQEIQNFHNLRLLSKLNCNFSLLKFYMDTQKTLFSQINPNAQPHEFFASLNPTEKCILFRKGGWVRVGVWDDDEDDEPELKERNDREADSPNLRTEIINSLVTNPEIFMASLEEILNGPIIEATTPPKGWVSSNYTMDTTLFKQSIQHMLNAFPQADRDRYLSKIGDIFAKILNHNKRLTRLSPSKNFIGMINDIMKGNGKILPGPFNMDQKTERWLIENGLDPQICPEDSRKRLQDTKESVDREDELYRQKKEPEIKKQDEERLKREVEAERQKQEKIKKQQEEADRATQAKALALQQQAESSANSEEALARQKQEEIERKKQQDAIDQEQRKDLARQQEEKAFLELSNFEKAAEILLGSKHSDKIIKINKELSNAFLELKKYSHILDAGAKANVQATLKQLRDLGQSCHDIITHKDDPKKMWAIRRLMNTMVDILTGSGEASLTIEGWRLKNMANRLEPNQKTFNYIVNLLAMALIYLTKALVNIIILAKAIVKDTKVTYKPEHPEQDGKYPKKGIRSRKP